MGWQTSVASQRPWYDWQAQNIFNGKQVLGDRELLEDDVTVGELAVASAKQPAIGSNMHLHIVCKLKDIESVSIATSMQRTLTFKNEDVSPQPIRRSKSALTALLSTSDR